MVTIQRESAVTVDEFIDVLNASGLGERRPVDDPPRLATMLKETDLIITARSDGRLIGIARSITDFAYCCYLSDLAVAREFQSQGIGEKLMNQTQRHLDPRATLILLSAPAAVEYYPKIGFTKHPAAFTRPCEAEE